MYEDHHGYVIAPDKMPLFSKSRGLSDFIENRIYLDPWSVIGRALCEAKTGHAIKYTSFNQRKVNDSRTLSTSTQDFECV